jgi:4-hydroxy-3-methylbut-2-enyl diphosphate reductase
MNRSVVREFQAPGIRVPRGEVLVPAELGDPVRGALSCPAAPLVAGSLRRKGYRVSFAAVPRFEDPAHHGDGAALYVVTCQQRDGGTAALAAAVAPDDRLAAAAARSAVEEWAGVLGTRRAISAGSPWCGGARQALEAVRRAISDSAGQGRVVHVHGQLAGPPETRAELASRGAVLGGSLQDAVRGDVIVFPAHGVTPAMRAEAIQRGLTIVDATCPLVAWAQAEAGRLADRGEHVVLLGQENYPAADGITSRAEGRATVIATVAGTSTLQVADARRVSYLLQPGIPIEDSAAAAAALRSRFPAVRGPHPDSFCYAPSDRAETVRTVAAGSDLMLVLGDAAAADARQLSALARDCGTRAQVIADPAEITPAMLAGISDIGIAESTSARAGLAGEITAALSGLGPLSVLRRQVSTQITDNSVIPVRPGDAQAGDATPAAAVPPPPTAAPATASPDQALPDQALPDQALPAPGLPVPAAS